MKNKEDILDRVENLNEVSVFVDKGDFYLESLISETLEDGETNDKIIKGISENSKGLILFTDRRVIFVGRTFITPFDAKVKCYAYRDIRSVEYKKGFLYGKLVVVDGLGKTEELKMIPNYQAKGLPEYLDKLFVNKI